MRYLYDKHKKDIPRGSVNTKHLENSSDED